MNPSIDLRRLRTLWLISLAIGGLGSFLGLLWVASPGGPGLDWIWGIAAFGAGVLLYNAAFFTLCSLFASGLANLVEDDTEVEGDNVVHVVKHAETGDEAFDFYIRSYATARGTTAVAIISSIMITLALIFF